MYTFLDINSVIQSADLLQLSFLIALSDDNNMMHARRQEFDQLIAIGLDVTISEAIHLAAIVIPSSKHLGKRHQLGICLKHVDDVSKHSIQRRAFSVNGRSENIQ